MLDKATAGIAAPTIVPKTQQGELRRLNRYLCLNDFEPAARRILPKYLSGYIAGGVETDAALRYNRRAFEEYGFVPRVLKDVSSRNQKATLLGKPYDSPFGISPMRASALCAYRGDIALARPAEATGVPMTLSAWSLIALEDVRRKNEGVWYQAYLQNDDRIVPVVHRAAAAGYDTFVVTADLPVSPNREQHIRNRFQVPLAITPRVFWDTISHSGWLFNTFARTVVKHDMPHFENMDAARSPSILSKPSMRDIDRPDQLAWKHIELIRRRWNGKLVIKGLISPEDARIARESGVDGVVLSNHGGRQLNYAISGLRTLPVIAPNAKGMTVMLDGGIRRGSDVIKALALRRSSCGLVVLSSMPQLLAASPVSSGRSRSCRLKSTATLGCLAFVTFQRSRPISYASSSRSKVQAASARDCCRAAAPTAIARYTRDCFNKRHI